MDGRVYQRRPIRREDEETESNEGLSTTQATCAVLAIFITSIVAVGLIYMNFPNLEEHEKQHMKVPFDLEAAQKLGLVLDRYKDRYFLEVFSGICVVYIFLQTFAIPGSLFLSILSGFLFPFIIAITLVCCCSAIGATLCFLLSQLLGRRLVKHYIPERAAKWAESVKKHKDNLFHYMLFLRITPFLPNWFINLVAPVVGVPLFPFAFGTFLGVAPPSIIAIHTGKTLHHLTSTSAWSWSSVAILGVLAVLSLIPVIWKGKLKEKFE